ncbi:MAG: recombinase family protein [Oscillospiraceae bacterium]|nr:recombinase family protein [Oscillospiraceae bacterium]
MKELRIATFARGSTTKQTSKGKAKKASLNRKTSAREISLEDDLPLQKDSIREFINSQPELSKGIKWIMTDLEYIEAGVSAFHTHVSKRKGLNQAFDDAKAGLYDILVIYKLDRFGRRSVESLNHALKFLKHCRIWVVDKKREFTNNGDADEILNFIEFWSARKSSVDTQIRVTDAMQLIHKEGYWTGGNPPFGYINHPELSNMLQVVPHEAETVREIYKMYTTDGFGMLKIAGILNEQNIKTKSGNDWNSGIIRKILRNTVYKGYLSYGKTKTTDGEFGSYQKYTKDGEESVSGKYWSEYDIVGEETWAKAQKIRHSRVKTNSLFGGKTPSKSQTGQGLLVGLLKCECGSNMTRGSSRDWLNHKRTEKGELYGTYRCLKRIKAGAAACGASKGQYKCADLDATVIKTVKDYMQNMVTADMLCEIKKKSAQTAQVLAEKLKSAKQEIEHWTKVKNKSNDELRKFLIGEASEFNREQLTELYEEAVRELERATRAYSQLQASTKSKTLDEASLMKLKRLIDDWNGIFSNATIEIKRRMIAAVVSEIRLNGTDVDVEIAFDYAGYIDSVP